MVEGIEGKAGDREPPRRERRRAARKRALYEAALDLLTRKGYDRVTVEEIAEAADVSKGTFFNYFPTKAHLLVEYRHSLLEFIHDYGEAQTGDSARALCKSYFRKLARKVKTEGERYDMLFKEVVARPHLFVLDPGERRDYRTYFRRYLEIGRAGGEIPAGCDLELLAETMRDIWTGTSVSWFLETPGRSLESLILRKIDFLFDQLQGGTRSGI